MMTMLAPLAVAMLVGISAAIVVYTLFRVAALRETRVTEDDVQGAWLLRFVPILDLVPVPASVQRMWRIHATQSKILHAGLLMSNSQYVAFRWLLVWVLVASGMLIAIGHDWDLLGLFLFSALTLGGWFYPEIWLRRRIESRKLEIDLALPEFLDRLALGLEAGLGFEIALRRTARNFSGLLGEELRFVVRQLDRGHTSRDVLERMLERVPSTDLGAFVAAVKQADHLGTSLARTLQIQKKLMRSRRKRRAEEASRRLPILIVFPLVFFFLPALLIIYLAPPLLHLFLGQ